ncbi:hypothetical protein K501DRAFT_234251 [Backusella circina FSU 941]|nr:hypothetical protein K501DRAFT_234251 [Backusella circina FSU 941]
MITEAIALLILPVTATYFLYNAYSGTFQLFQNMQTSTADNCPETKTPISLNLVSGVIPQWLNGIMYRVGSGTFQIPQVDGSTFVIRHAFDGLPIAHRFEISGDKQSVTYNSRSLSDGVIDDIRNKRTNGMIFFGNVMDISFFSWLFQFATRVYVTMISKKRPSTKPDSQRVGVTITPNFPLPVKQEQGGNVLVTKTDVNILQKINAKTLEPESLFTYTKFNKDLKGRFSAAHHQVDLQTGEIFNFVGIFDPEATLRIFSTTPSGETTVLSTITHRLDKERTPVQIPYIHSFWLTKNYVIIPEFPLYYANKSFNTLVHGTALSSMKWDATRPAYLHVVRRKLDHANQDGLVASIPVPGFYEFHTANAFESLDANGNTMLNLDCCAFEDGNIIYHVHSLFTAPEKYISKPKNAGVAHNGIRLPESKHMGFGDLRRYSLNLSTKSLNEIITLAPNLEFPRFNQDYLFQEYTYVYATTIVSQSDSGGVPNIALVKANVKDRTTLVYGKEGYSFSEPIFVQRSKEIEDDGVLLALGNTKDCCYLFVVDAATMKELACFAIGEFTAATFHGSYVDYDFTPVNVN